MSGKPWPSDALMIVCETPERANRANMRTVEPAQCRDCKCDLSVDGASIELAMENPHRGDRRIEYFCIACAIGYDINSIDYLTDNRGGRLTKNR